MNDRSLPSTTVSESNPRSDTHHAGFDWSGDEPVSDRVVEVVAAAAGVCTTELRPLYDYLEPEALDELYRPTLDGSRRAAGRTSFTYEGYLVTVASDGEILVRRREGDER